MWQRPVFGGLMHLWIGTFFLALHASSGWKGSSALGWGLVSVCLLWWPLRAVVVLVERLRGREEVLLRKLAYRLALLVGYTMIPVLALLG